MSNNTDFRAGQHAAANNHATAPKMDNAIAQKQADAGFNLNKR